MERLGNIDDLPPELKKQIKGCRPTFNNHVVDVLQKLGGKATVNELIIAMYREHGYVPKSRNSFIHLVHRAKNKGHIKLVGPQKFALVKAAEKSKTAFAVRQPDSVMGSKP